jgi:hypothetical protein
LHGLVIYHVIVIDIRQSLKRQLSALFLVVNPMP